MSQVGNSYTLSTTTDLRFADAVARTREELATEGFGEEVSVVVEVKSWTVWVTVPELGA